MGIIEANLWAENAPGTRTRNFVGSDIAKPRVAAMGRLRDGVKEIDLTGKMMGRGRGKMQEHSFGQWTENALFVKIDIMALERLLLGV